MHDRDEPEHVHPKQESSAEVRSWCLVCEVDAQAERVGPGESITLGGASIEAGLLCYHPMTPTEHSKADIAFHAVVAPSYDRLVTDEYDIYDQLSLVPFLDRAAVRGPDLKVLDLGCGTGAVTVHLAARGVTVDAVDHSPDMIEIARSKVEREGGAERVRFQVADAGDLPFENARFDGVTCQRVLHHIPDPAPVLAEVMRVLKPGGFLYLSDNIADPSPAGRVLRLLWRMVLTRIRKEPPPRPEPGLPSVEEVHRSGAELKAALAGAGFSYELRFFTHVGLRSTLSTNQRALLIKVLSFPWRRKRGDLIFAYAIKP